jgi:hypothetical protein
LPIQEILCKPKKADALKAREIRGLCGVQISRIFYFLWPNGRLALKRQLKYA